MAPPPAFIITSRPCSPAVLAVEIHEDKAVTATAQRPTGASHVHHASCHFQKLTALNVRRPLHYAPGWRSFCHRPLQQRRLRRRKPVSCP